MKMLRNSALVAAISLAALSATPALAQKNKDKDKDAAAPAAAPAKALREGARMILKRARLPRVLQVLGARGPSEADVLAELERREGQSGLEEFAARWLTEHRRKG